MCFLTKDALKNEHRYVYTHAETHDIQKSTNQQEDS